MSRILISVFMFALLASCATNPVTGDPNFVLLTEAQEVSMGRSADQDVKKQYALYDENHLAAYVDEVGQRLAKNSHRPHLDYRFTLLDSNEVNAFALPGGYVYITRGIIAYLNSEAELAAVLGHEIGHVNARHSVRQVSAAQGADIALNVISIFNPGLRSQGGQTISGLLGNVLLSGYGRDHELEADRLGAEYLARTGYDPQAMIRVIGVLKGQEQFDADAAKQDGREPHAYHGLFASHPDNDTRLKEVVGAASSLHGGALGDRREIFLLQTRGMIFGDSPREGVVRAGSFYHPDLGFALKLPANWHVQNLPDRLVLLAPGGATQLTMMQGKPNQTPLEQLRAAGRAGNDVETTPVNTLPAAISVNRGVLSGVIHMGDKAYLFSTAAKSGTLSDEHARAARDTIKSFHKLSDVERAQARPLRIKTLTATPATRYAELAKTSPLGRNAEGYLRLINGMYPTGEPRPGQAVKVVE